jgi:hypothetical protein
MQQHFCQLLANPIGDAGKAGLRGHGIMLDIYCKARQIIRTDYVFSSV